MCVHRSLHDNTAVLVVLLEFLYRRVIKAFCYEGIREVPESWELSAISCTYYYARVVQNGKECLLIQY